MEKNNSTFELESQLLGDGYDWVIGIDEAGRGPLAGPVVASAVAWRKSEILNPKSETNSKLEALNLKQIGLIRDSKTLSEKQRENIFDFIQENFYVGVGVCNHEVIDRINILEATFLAMKKAIAELNSKLQVTNNKQIPNSKFQNHKKIILVDGNKKIPNFTLEQKAVIGGDRIVKSISAASIIAKVTRDWTMREWHEKYPQYDFLKHKGYGTKTHIEAIRRFGPCEIHRRSFGPVKKTLEVMRSVF